MLLPPATNSADQPLVFYRALTNSHPLPSSLLLAGQREAAYTQETPYVLPDATRSVPPQNTLGRQAGLWKKVVGRPSNLNHGVKGTELASLETCGLTIADIHILFLEQK